MASSSKTRYGWQFPDGTVIPVDEKYKVKDKLLESDRFLGKLSNDELRGGNLYSEAYNLDLEYLVEDGYDNPDYFMEMYGVTIVDRGGPEEDRFRLRDGRTVDIQGLYDWLAEEEYTFDDWFRLDDNRFGYEFMQMAEVEAEVLAENKDPEAMAYYGVRMVDLDDEDDRYDPISLYLVNFTDGQRCPLEDIGVVTSYLKSLGYNHSNWDLNDLIDLARYQPEGSYFDAGGRSWAILNKRNSDEFPTYGAKAAKSGSKKGRGTTKKANHNSRKKTSGKGSASSRTTISHGGGFVSLGNSYSGKRGRTKKASPPRNTRKLSVPGKSKGRRRHGGHAPR